MVGWRWVMATAVTWQLCGGGHVGDDDNVVVAVMLVVQ